MISQPFSSGRHAALDFLNNAGRCPMISSGQVSWSMSLSSCRPATHAGSWCVPPHSLHNLSPHNIKSFAGTATTHQSFQNRFGPGSLMHLPCFHPPQVLLSEPLSPLMQVTVDFPLDLASPPTRDSLMGIYLGYSYSGRVSGHAWCPVKTNGAHRCL